MKNHSFKLASSLSAAVALTVGFSAQAATYPLYAGGSTLAEKVYRDIFNAYGNQAGGDLLIGVNSAGLAPATPYNSGVEVLYAGIGSGNAVTSIDTYNAANFQAGGKTPDNPPVASTRDFGPYYGTGTGASWTPDKTGGPAYPKLSFVGSDNVLVSSDVTAITGLGFGAPIQVPTLVTAIAIPFTPASGTWTPNGGTPAGYSSKVSFSTNTWCGIFTGAINTWNNASITADNGKKVLGSGTITVVYRNDSSGTTFIFTNALLNQCGTTSHPNSSYPVPDQWLTDAGVANTPPFVSTTKFYIKVFGAGHLPSNFLNNPTLTGVSGGANGTGGVALAVDAIPGAVGYVSPDVVLPAYKGVGGAGKDSNGNPVAAAANLESYYSYVNTPSKPKFVAQTPTTAASIMSTFSPPSFSGSPAPAANPLNWGVINPAPSSSGAYPIGGFTFLDMYSCYGSSASDSNPLVGTTAGSLGLWRWYYGSTSEQTVHGGPTVASILAADGFASLPSSWISAVKTLIFSTTSTKIGYPKEKSTACASISKGA